jgi:hypothetical protein
MTAVLILSTIGRSHLPVVPIALALAARCRLGSFQNMAIELKQREKRRKRAPNLHSGHNRILIFWAQE